MQTPMLGEIVLYAFSWAPAGWAPCDGRALLVRENQSLAMMLQDRYGPFDPNVTLPHFAPIVPNVNYFIATRGQYIGGAELGRPTATNETILFPVDATLDRTSSCNGQSGALDLSAVTPPKSHYMLVTTGDAPAPYGSFVGQVNVFPAGTQFEGWLPCDGRSLRIADYEALYVLLENQFGGNAVEFSLPDLRPVTPVGARFDIAVAGYFPPRP